MNLPTWPLDAGLPPIPAEAQGVCLILSRAETTAPRVGRSVDDLLQLTDDDRLRRQLAHGMFFCFDGWDADAREVVAIPECRAYLQALHAQWPYWLHFLAPVPELWQTLLLALIDIEPAPGAPALAGKTAWSVDITAVRRLVKDMLTPMNLLHNSMGLSETERRAVFDGSLAAIAQAFGGQPVAGAA